MDIELTTSSQVKAYDLQTNFASSAVAPGMKAICKYAVSNNNRIDQESIIEQGYASNQAGARNLITSGIESGVWDSDGLLTEDGHETAKTGEVLNSEIGPLRIWTFDHETTGAVLLHADRLGLLPSADAEPSSHNPPDTLQLISNGKTSKSIKPGDNRRWRIQYTKNGSSWALQKKFCSSAKLSWSWKYDEGWILDENIFLKGTISGTSKKPANDMINVNKAYPQTGSLNPDHLIREWLSKGRFSSGPWVSNLGGLTRPFAQLSGAEKSMQITNEVLESEIEEWDHISISEIPLFAKTLDDASDWVIYLINEETPGYTTTEDTNRKLGDILERPFMCLDSEKVRARVEDSLSSSRADPRLSKLLHAGDDLDSIALVPEWVLSQKRDENVAIHDGSDDYSEFVKQISQNMKGKIKKVIYVNNYVLQKSVRNRLSLFENALTSLDSAIKLEVLTSHYPYTKNHGNNKSSVNEFKSKIQDDINANVVFMDFGKYGQDALQCQTAHDRVIIIESDKETRYWKITTKGIHIKDKSPCVKVELNELEKWLKNHIRTNNSTPKEALQ